MRLSLNRPVRNAAIVSLTVALAIALGTSAPQSSLSIQPPSAAERSLMNEWAGLGLMNDTVGSTLPQINQREKLMTGYIHTKGLDDEFASYAAPKFKPGVTFQQALTAAVNEISANAPVMPEDPDTLSREVAAQTVLVQGSWDELQAARKHVFAMTGFVRSKNLFDDYHAWAIKTSAEMAAKAKADAEAWRAKATAEAQAQAAQHAAAMHQLQEQWDKLPYSTGIDYNYTNNSNRSSGSSGSTQYPQGNGSYDNDGYWNGSYYNGYADPYYDVWGGAAAARGVAGAGGVGGAGGAGGWNSYWRGNGHASGAYHPSGGATISPPRPARGRPMR